VSLGNSRRFERFQRQGQIIQELLLDLEHESTTILRNVGNYSPNDRATHVKVKERAHNMCIPLCLMGSHSKEITVL
jgi:hypothetical protein